MFSVLVNQLYTTISSAFGWGESLFAKFGISLLLLFMVMTAIQFFVRMFIAPFLK